LAGDIGVEKDVERLFLWWRILPGSFGIDALYFL
jgi:hypothetical protein